jgi:S-adenosylmethionine-dependent methyltransferase
MPTSSDDERFRSGAEKYATYLATPEGRLRLDLSFAYLQECLPNLAAPLLALDIGCGTGAIAVRLAQLGVHVTALDASLTMLELAECAARNAGVTKRIALKHGDVSQLADLFHPDSFDLVICHNTLEYVDDPDAVLKAAACTLRAPSGVLSVLVRNQSGEVLKTAIQDGDLARIEHSLTAEWGNESLYGGKVRLFTSAGLQAKLEAASLTVMAVRGVRVISDYLPQCISRNDEYDRIVELEQNLGRRPEFGAIGRYIQCLAHRRRSARGLADEE